MGARLQRNDFCYFSPYRALELACLLPDDTAVGIRCLVATFGQDRLIYPCRHVSAAVVGNDHVDLRVGTAAVMSQQHSHECFCEWCNQHGAFIQRLERTYKNQKSTVLCPPTYPYLRKISDRAILESYAKRSKR